MLKGTETQAPGCKRLLWGSRLRFSPICSKGRASSVSDRCLWRLCHSIHTLRDSAGTTSARPSSQQARGKSSRVSSQQRNAGWPGSVGPPTRQAVGSGLLVVHGGGHSGLRNPFLCMYVDKHEGKHLSGESVRILLLTLPFLLRDLIAPEVKTA